MVDMADMAIMDTEVVFRTVGMAVVTAMEVVLHLEAMAVVTAMEEDFHLEAMVGAMVGNIDRY